MVCFLATIRARNLEPQLGILADHGIREDLIFSDVASGQNMNRTGWKELMPLVQPRDTIVIAFLDRFSRNFEEGVRIQAELTGRDIGIVALRENVDTSDGSAAAKFFRRSMLAQGAYQVDSTSERIKLGLDGAGAGWKEVGRTPAFSPKQVEECRWMAGECVGLRPIARAMTCSPRTSSGPIQKRGIRLAAGSWHATSLEIPEFSWNNPSRVQAIATTARMEPT